MNSGLECYICHKVVPRHDYARHVGSHLAGGVTGTRNGINYENDEGSDYSDKIDDGSDYTYEEDDFRNTNIGSHPAGGVTRTRSDINYGYDKDSDDSDGTDDDSDYGYKGDFRGHDTTIPMSTLPRMASAVSRTSRAAVIHSKPNAFQFWKQNFEGNFLEYTTIDGQAKRRSDSEANEFIRNAETLRDTSKAEVIKIVEEFKEFSNNERQACLQLVRKAPIFPGLVAYVYTHLVKCAPRGWLWSTDWLGGADWSSRVSDLKQLVEGWDEDGYVKCILSCGIIKKRLLEILRDAKVSPGEHKCNPALLNGKSMLDCDIRNLAAAVAAAVCITGPQKEKIIHQRDTQAERLVELFHSLLEVDVELEERYRRCFLNALVKFSKECGYCPRDIYLADDSVTDLEDIQRQGGFGVVRKGWIGSHLVAVKVLKRNDDVSLSAYKKELSKEAIVWSHLYHPNCLPLYGVYDIVLPTTKDIGVALVSPWMERGTLADYLEQNSEISEANRTRLILDVVRGLDYLHSMRPHIAHRDIKPQNILITKQGRACLADFGLVSVFDTDEHFRTATDKLVICGTRPYMAPEMLRANLDEDAKRKVNRRACDMYALGCTIYVFYTCNSPYQVQVDLMSDPPPVKISADMWSFVQNLCGSDPSKRLTAEVAVSWMAEKARLEGVDASPAPIDDEWKWRGSRSDMHLWSV